MNGFDSNKIKSSIVNKILGTLKDWSDIDLLIVVRKLDFDTKY